MLRKQVLIALGVLAALGVCLGVVSHAVGAHAGGDLATADRLALALHWLLLPGLCLFAGIAMTANHRFFSSEAIDGAAPSRPGAFEINLRYNQNTLEQTVLAAVAWSGLALSLPAKDLDVIPAMAGLFVVGRAAFWIGYLYAPWARAFGLGLTFYPTVAALVWLAARALATR